MKAAMMTRPRRERRTYVLVLRNAGPGRARGWPGMGQCLPSMPKALLKPRGTRHAAVSDARIVGHVLRAACILHVAAGIFRRWATGAAEDRRHRAHGFLKARKPCECWWTRGELATSPRRVESPRATVFGAVGLYVSSVHVGQAVRGCDLTTSPAAFGQAAG